MDDSRVVFGFLNDKGDPYDNDTNENHYARHSADTYIEITGPETETMKKQTFPVNFFTPLNNYLEEARELLMYSVL